MAHPLLCLMFVATADEWMQLVYNFNLFAQGTHGKTRKKRGIFVS